MPRRRETRFERHLPGDDARASPPVVDGISEETAAPTEGGSSGGGGLGCAVYGLGWIALGALAFRHLEPFVSELPLRAFLAFFGCLLGWTGVLFLGLTLRYLLRPLTALGHLAGGAALLGLAALMMIPAWPGDVLESAFFGDAVFDARNDMLEDAIEAGDVDRVRALGRVGLRDPVPRDTFDDPLLHDAKGVAMVRALLEAGLDPDAADDDGWTLLMGTDDPDVARALLEAGAEPDLRDPHGRTALMFAAARRPDLVPVLLDAGADPTAVSAEGRAVVDFAGDDEVRTLLEGAAGGRDLRAGSSTGLAARSDWLLVVGDGAGLETASSVRFEPEDPGRGEVGRLIVDIVHPGPGDRRVRVDAELGIAAYFVDASHGGVPLLPEVPDVRRTVRWPSLALPAESAGRLELQFVTRVDTDAGDLVVDVRVFDLATADQEVLVATAVPRAESFGTFGSPLWTALFVATPLLFMLSLFAAIKWGGPRGRAAVLWAVAGLLLLGVWGMVSSMIAPYSWESTECTVLDQRIRLETSRSTSSSGSNTTTTHERPWIAARYATPAGEVVSTGFAASFASASKHDLRDFPIGETFPCWFDPERPEDFALLRKPGLFGILGMLLMTAVAAALIVAGRLVV